jgi:hypothetical protein
LNLVPNNPASPMLDSEKEVVDISILGIGV